MSNEMIPTAGAGTPTVTLSEALEKAITRNDFSQVGAEDRLLYLRTVCQSLGLNPLTMPLAYLTDRKGKVTLYVKKEGTDQLRKINNVTLEIVSHAVQQECYIVHVRASMLSPHGGARRTDEEVGVVSLAGIDAGEARANAIMKAVTKAKRRVTLSICGLGWSDESEVEGSEFIRPVADPVQQQQVKQLPAPPTSPTPAPPPAPAVSEQPTAVATVSAKASVEQLTELRRLKDLHNIDAPTWLKILNKRGVGTARDLTAEQASELIHAMQARAVVQDMERDTSSSANANGRKEPAAASSKARGSAF